jgi:uncharacterized protein YndB with AHSA1/START domain
MEAEAMYTTRLEQYVRAPRSAVYQALLDPDAIAHWRVPDGMTSTVHEFSPNEGGSFRVSLTYDAPGPTGKSAAHTDTYHGRFVQLLPNKRVVEELEFETTDPALQGTMTMTTTLADAGGGSIVTVLHEGMPDAVPVADNELGMRMALAKLARLVESGASELVELRARAADGDRDAVDQLVELAGERGDMDELRRLADAGSRDAADQLVELAAERLDINELRRLADRGNSDAADVLAELADEQDDTGPPRT